MMLVVFFVTALCAFSEAAVELKRDSCHRSDLPDQCELLLDTELRSAIYSSTADDRSIYCNETCIRPLYDYFANCEGGEPNAILFDFYCTSNAAGESCQQFVGNDNANPPSLLTLCLNSFGECESTCRDALNSASASTGCCLYSNLAVLLNERTANTLFDSCNPSLPRNLCVGRASNATLDIPPILDVNSECEELVDGVDESCREFLSERRTVDFNTLCDHPCGQRVYQLLRDCDNLTDDHDAIEFHALCSKNSDGDYCYSHFSTLNSVNLGVCDLGSADSCPSACREEMIKLSGTGCCASSYFYRSNGKGYINSLATYCEVDLPDTCDEAFSQESPTKEGKCQNQLDKVPQKCSSFLPYKVLLKGVFSNSSNILNTFCKTDCAKAVYNYIECDNKTNAAEIDFICSQSESGTNCIDIFTDSALNAVIDDESGVCKDATDKQCSNDCQNAIARFDDDYGCCFYTYTALGFNVTYADGLFAQCGLKNTELCTGGITNATINAPGFESAGEDVVASTLILILAFILTLHV